MANDDLEPNLPLQESAGNYDQRKNRTLPLFSFSAAILGIVLLLFCGGIPLGVFAIITGLLGASNAKAAPEYFSGRGLAIAGIILGVLELFVTITFIALKQLNNLGAIR
jgi:hypothetical protein